MLYGSNAKSNCVMYFHREITFTLVDWSCGECILYKLTQI